MRITIYSIPPQAPNVNLEGRAVPPHGFGSIRGARRLAWPKRPLPLVLVKQPASACFFPPARTQTAVLERPVHVILLDLRDEGGDDDERCAQDQFLEDARRAIPGQPSQKTVRVASHM